MSFFGDFLAVPERALRDPGAGLALLFWYSTPVKQMTVVSVPVFVSAWCA